MLQYVRLFAPARIRDRGRELLKQMHRNRQGTYRECTSAKYVDEPGNPVVSTRPDAQGVDAAPKDHLLLAEELLLRLYHFACGDRDREPTHPRRHDGTVSR